MDIFELFRKIDQTLDKSKIKDASLRKHPRGHYYIVIRMTKITSADLDKLLELRKQYYIEILPAGKEAILVTIHDIETMQKKELGKTRVNVL